MKNENYYKIFAIVAILTIAYMEYKIYTYEPVIVHEIEYIDHTIIETEYINVEQQDTVNIISLSDGKVVHSKVIIDAVLSGNITSVKVKINNITKANYLPYIWNNILEPAGTYNIDVIAETSIDNITDSVDVVIPEREWYTPENFTIYEDFVVHEGQSVTFMPGTYDFGINYTTNGINYIGKIPCYINVYGSLELINATFTNFKGISCEQSSLFTLHNSVLMTDNLIIDPEGIVLLQQSTMWLFNSTVWDMRLTVTYKTSLYGSSTVYVDAASSASFDLFDSAIRINI